MPASLADVENEETSRKRPRSEDESTETGPKQAEQHGDSTSIPSTSKQEDILQPPIFKVNYPFLRSSVKRLKKDASPPPQPLPTSKKTDKTKEDDSKPVKAVKAERKRWEAWGNQDKTLFFEGLNEYGKDFEAIQKYIEQRHKKRGDPGGQVKNKDQVRHLYYRTCHKLFKYIIPDTDQTKTANELYALINYGELRKKIKGVIDARTGQKLAELVKKGSTTIRYQQRNTRLRTPTCKALKLLKAVDEEENVKPIRLPPRVMLELTPKNNAAWATVQGVAHNPRVRMVVPLRKELGSLLNMLSEKWTPHRIKLLQSMKPTASESVPQAQLQTQEGAIVTPYNQLTGYYIHDKGKVPFYPGITIPPTKPGVKRSRKGSVKGAAETVVSHAETMVSPVETMVSLAEIMVSRVETMVSSAEPMVSPAETMISPAETMISRVESMVSPAERIGSPTQIMASSMEAEASVAQHVEVHDGIDIRSAARTNHPLFQFEERFKESPYSEEGMDMSLPTDFTPIPLTEITEDFSVPVNQTDHTRIEVSNHRRKTEEVEPAETGSGNIVENVDAENCAHSLGKEEVGVVEEGKNIVQELTKDARLQMGVTKESVGDISITDVYLMLGMPKVLKLVYDFIHTTASSQPTIKLLERLSQLAKTEFSEIVKPKQMVSIGVATSPTRLGIPPRTAETPPSKSSAPNYSKSPVSSRGGSIRKATPLTPKSGNVRSTAPIIVSPATAAAAVAKACEARGIADRPQPRREMSVFLAPKPVAPRRITPTPAGGGGGGDAERIFKQQLDSLTQKSYWQLPKRPARKARGRRPLVVQRTLLPRPQSDDVRHMMSMSIVSNSSHASTGQFMPVKLGVVSPGGEAIGSPQGPQPNGKTVVIATKPNNATTGSSSSAIIASNNIMVASLLASSPKTPSSTCASNSHFNSPVGSPLGPIFISSPVPSPLPVEALSPADMSSMVLSPAQALSPVMVDMTNTGSPLSQATNQILMTNPMTHNALANDPLLSTPSSKCINSSSLNTPSPLLNKTTDAVAALMISPPNISSLLEISLPSAESASSVATDTLMDLGISLPGFEPPCTTNSNSSPSRTSGTTTPPLTMTSPSTSPFKLSSLGADNQWLNGEVADISFGSILAHLESPEKKDKAASGNLCASFPPRFGIAPICSSPSHIFYDTTSRDSNATIMSKDVDTHLQYLMNENSIDYVAKFADLAAHITASAEPPKN